MINLQLTTCSRATSHVHVIIGVIMVHIIVMVRYHTIYGKNFKSFKVFLGEIFSRNSTKMGNVINRTVSLPSFGGFVLKQR